MEKIFHGGKLVAIRIRRFSDGSQSITSSAGALQLLTSKHSKGHLVKPHKHIPKKRVTNSLETCVVVIRGKIRIDLFGGDKKCFRKFFLTAGDAAILLWPAHAVYFVENSEFYELKNGPFIDDKVLI